MQHSPLSATTVLGEHTATPLGAKCLCSRLMLRAFSPLPLSPSVIPRVGRASHVSAQFYHPTPKSPCPFTFQRPPFHSVSHAGKESRACYSYFPKMYYSEKSNVSVRTCVQLCRIFSYSIRQHDRQSQWYEQY